MARGPRRVGQPARDRERLMREVALAYVAAMDGGEVVTPPPTLPRLGTRRDWQPRVRHQAYRGRK